MERKYSLKRSDPDDRDYVFSRAISPHAKVKIPSSVDLRKLCPVIFDQGNIGSCSSQAGSAYVSMLWNQKDIIYSRLFLYYFERFLEGTVDEDSGAQMRDVCKALQKFGVCLEEEWPYVIEKFKNKPTTKSITSAKSHKILTYHSLLSLLDIKNCLALKQSPVLLGMICYESMESETVARTGKLPIPKNNERELGGHAVLVVGYHDYNFAQRLTNRSGGYLIVRNSWGDWGDKGYFYMPYEYLSPDRTFDYWVIDG